MKKIFFAAIIFNGIIFCNTNAQEQKYKAIFIYNFTKYLNWPSSAIGNEFIIGVLGNDDIIDELKLIADIKTISNREIVVKRITPNGINQPLHILFIPKENHSLLKNVCESLNNLPVLVITEKTNACSEGADINFTQKNNNLSFELNKASITRRGISINSQLLNLASHVD